MSKTPGQDGLPTARERPHSEREPAGSLAGLWRGDRGTRGVLVHRPSYTEDPVGQPAPKADGLCWARRCAQTFTI